MKIIRFLCVHMMIIFLLWISLIVGNRESASASVQKMIGLGVNCGNAGCQDYPLNVTTLCVFPTTCPRMIAVDWTDENRFYGSNGSSCLVSNNKGITWSSCGSTPWSTSLYHIAVTKNGYVIASGNDLTFYRIFRSVDGGLTWTIVYEVSGSGTTDSVTVTKGRLHCSRISTKCTTIVRNSLVNSIDSLVSNDEGLTWTRTTISSTSISYETGTMSMDDELSLGINTPSNSDGISSQYKALLWDGNTWSLSTIWPSTNGGICFAAYILNGNRRGMCNISTTGSSHSQRDHNGLVLNTFNMSGSSSLDVDFLAISVRPNAIWVVGGAMNPAGTAVWVSIDNGVTFTRIATPVAFAMTNVGRIVKGLDGCVYASFLAGIGSAVIKVC